MNYEEMGRPSKGLRLAFAITSVVFLLVLAISPLKDLLQQWKRYKKEFVRFAQTRPDTKRLLADFHSGIDQIWIPNLNVVDRCSTCHLGITQPSLVDSSVPEPFRGHPTIPHRAKEWGCVVCHRGQGLATEMKEAHQTTLAWEQPLLPVAYIQASCGVCHRGELADTPKLNRGRELLEDLNCVGCHRLQGIERPPMIGPDLTDVGNKVSREWIYKWLKEPRTITDSNGNVVVNGYENEEEPRMPQFRLNEQELRALSGYLSSLKSRALEPYKFDARVIAAWEKKPDLVQQGEVRFRQMFCVTCHSLAVTRAGETKLIGGDIGPELSKVGSKVNGDWLAAWLRNPGGYLPHALMPRYQWTDEDLFKVTRYIQSNLTDPDLLSNLPSLGPPRPDEIQLGQRIFVEKGCASCHVIKGVKPQSDFGPDLSQLGSKTVSQLLFGEAKIPHTLVAYIRTKIADPVSVNPAARMPQYHLKPEDLEALTSALLSMTGQPATAAYAQLVVPTPQAKFRPAGKFGEVYERYKCYVCHRFNGFGGTLAPDLTFEGSRAQRPWLIAFLKNPQTLRPALTFRMPQFGMTEEEAAILADYLGMVTQSPSVNPDGVNSKEFTPEKVNLGKQLYEVKYQCQSCHTIGASGGYVGPNLNNVGNWMNAAWISAWLKNPQALVPDAIEPRRDFTDEEITALTAYLTTLRQNPQTKGPRGTGGAPGGSR
ncbi:MAG: c-type cytochrome [Acidobacteriia bacterium]|nr:c-type cytochrome [Terriglobia bacterium]